MIATSARTALSHHLSTGQYGSKRSTLSVLVVSPIGDPTPTSAGTAVKGSPLHSKLMNYRFTKPDSGYYRDGVSSVKSAHSHLRLGFLGLESHARQGQSRSRADRACA